MFPLCKLGAQINQHDKCIHPNEERYLTGTWTTIEVDLDINNRYKIITIQFIYYLCQSIHQNPTGK